ncbi:MAG TPA: phosphodiester glycosidase family protein [Candidatus Tyrphobacter sp.]
MRWMPVALALASIPIAAAPAALPPSLSLAAPFPTVALQAPDVEPLAPGVQYGDYELWSAVGPISIHVVAIARNAPVRVESVLANDALSSNGETVSSMAARTDAIAGINADYFDIGATNRPTNIVVRDSVLLRTPRKRYALAILRTGGARFTEFSFTGSVQIGTQTYPLGAVNEMPSGPDAISLLTPVFGEVPPSPGVTLVSLEPTNGAPPFAAYRVLSFSQADDAQPAGYYLATGTNALSPGGYPDAGDALIATGTLAPFALDQLSGAVGGGPLILRDGRWYDDPDGPSGGGFDRRIPCSGAAIENDGTLLLIEVDGRRPMRSVGLTRPEFAELMRALGARDGIALDGGGSSTLAVRRLGDRVASLATSPSDGSERRIADGLFLYNDAPVGAAQHLVGSPDVVRVVAGAETPLALAAIDASDHPIELPTSIVTEVAPAALGRIVDGRFIATAAGSGMIRLRAGALSGSIPVEVEAAPARLVMLPPDPNVDPHGVIALTARAFDARGFEIALPQRMEWSTSDGRIDDLGRFVANEHDADVRLDVGGRVATMRITVGNHDVPLDVTGSLRFASIPRGGAGSAHPDASCDRCIRLDYAIGAQERAGYAIVERELPARSVGLSFDLQDDGSGAELRIALRNAIDEQILVTAATLDQPGSRRMIVRFPAGITGPIRLVGFYTIGSKATPNPAGSIRIGDVRALVAGSP